MKDIATNTNYLYFQADDGIHGLELWRSDGTATGTTLVKNIHFQVDSNPTDLTVMKDIATDTNYLYFKAIISTSITYQYDNSRTILFFQNNLQPLNTKRVIININDHGS